MEFQDTLTHPSRRPLLDVGTQWAHLTLENALGMIYKIIKKLDSLNQAFFMLCFQQEIHLFYFMYDMNAFFNLFSTPCPNLCLKSFIIVRKLSRI